MAYRLHAVAFLTTGSALIASSRHTRSFCWCRVCSIWRRRGASSSFRGPRLRWRIMIVPMTIMLRRHKPAVNHNAQIRLSWPSAVKVRSVVSVEVVCGILATKPCRLKAGWRRGDLAHARRSVQPSRETRSARALPILGMRAPSQLPSNVEGIVSIIEIYLQSARATITTARPQ